MNGFLVRLDNTASAPVNGASTKGNVLWPAVYTPAIFSASEQVARSVLFGVANTRLERFISAIQLLWLCEVSVCSSYIVAFDPVISYDRAQLLAQLTGVSSDVTQVTSHAVANISAIPADEFLTGDLSDIWGTSLSPMDKLGAVIAHFGTKA